MDSRLAVLGQDFPRILQCFWDHQGQQTAWTAILLGIVSQLSSVRNNTDLAPSSIFYFGYFIAEYPGVALLQKFPIAKFLGSTTPSSPFPFLSPYPSYILLT